MGNRNRKHADLFILQWPQDCMACSMLRAEQHGPGDIPSKAVQRPSLAARLCSMEGSLGDRKPATASRCFLEDSTASSSRKEQLSGREACG